MGSGGSGNHPVEVVGRIREHPDAKSQQVQQPIVADSKSVRVKIDQGYRDFVLDGVSVSGIENLAAFYAKYVESRVEDVRSGGRCTVMMYGPTGSGKSHTMFGSMKEPGVAYLALRQIMGKSSIEVSASVLEIYNEDVYDLLAAGTVAPISSPGPRNLKAISGRPKLEVRGKKVRNATSMISGDATKLAMEIAKVEKRRVVKSTNSNDRSSRSHCMVILDILGVGGRLVLVDMAGSENSDQAGTGTEAKIQTGKINQGNIALKRVVECIANGNPYIPYRDSKLTMLLQDSFEDDGSKILMILCASPDVKDVYKTICTLEYGAKAKCIVRLPISPPKESANSTGNEAVLHARLQFKDECLERLRAEYEQKVKDHEAEQEKLAERERELSTFRAKLQRVEAEWSQKMIKFEREMDQMMEEKLHKALEEEMRSERTVTVHDGARVMELERIIEKQKQEIEELRVRAEKAEAELLKAQKSMRSSSNNVVASLNSWACASSSSVMPTISKCQETPSPCKNLEIDFKFCCDSPCPSPSRDPSKVPDSPCPIPTDSPIAPIDSPRLAPINNLRWGPSKLLDSPCPSPNRVPASPDAARRARIENIFRLCGDGRERFKSDKDIAKSPRIAHGAPLRAVENLCLDTTPRKKATVTSIRHIGENLAPEVV